MSFAKARLETPAGYRQEFALTAIVLVAIGLAGSSPTGPGNRDLSRRDMFAVGC
jgi:hypothetical protein